MVPVIEAAFPTALMAGLGGLHRAAAGQGPTRHRAVGMAAVARRTDRKEAVAPAAGLLTEGLVHGVGARRATSDWTPSLNHDTTGATGSVCRRARQSRGSGGTRALTYVFPPVRYPKTRVDTTAGAMDAAAGVDAHDAPTPACKTARLAVLHKRPQPVIFLLIKNPNNSETAPTQRHASRLLHFHVSVDSDQPGCGGREGRARLNGRSVRLKPVWSRNSCGRPMVELQQAPEALPAPHWTGLVDLLVRKEEAVFFFPGDFARSGSARCTPAERSANDGSPKRISLDRHSSLTDRTHRSACGFRFGLRGGNRTGVTPPSGSMVSNAGQYFPSRS